MLQQQQAVVPAWIHGPNDAKANLHVHRERRTPTFLLERGDSHADGSIDFRTMRPDGKAFTAKELAAYEGELLRYNLAVGWLSLDGSMTPWMVVNSMGDVNAGGQLVMRLRSIIHGQRMYDVTPSYWHGLPLHDARRAKAENVLTRMVPANVLRSIPETGSDVSFTLPEGFPMSDSDAAHLQNQIRAALEALKL